MCKKASQLQKCLWNPHWKTSAFAVFFKYWSTVSTVCCGREGTEFIVGECNKIRQSVANLNFDPLNTLIGHAVTVTGTTYKSNMFVIVGHNNDGLGLGKSKKLSFIRIPQCTSSLRYIRLFVNQRLMLTIRHQCREPTAMSVKQSSLITNHYLSIQFGVCLC